MCGCAYRLAIALAEHIAQHSTASYQRPSPSHIPNIIQAKLLHCEESRLNRPSYLRPRNFSAILANAFVFWQCELDCTTRIANPSIYNITHTDTIEYRIFYYMKLILT
jgi:hypothetical protein